MAESLKQKLQRRRFIVAPGVFDMISLRIADRMGFDALYMTGYGTVASYLGLPDAGLATYTDMVDRLEVMAKAANTPLIADGDTGYGGLLNVQRTVRGYEAAGAAAIQIEDQEFPKKCGHTLNRRVIPMEEMVKKVKVAVESRDSSDFLIIARTDARTSLGLDEALRRGEAYARAGADILFIESPESEEEMARIGRTFDLPLVANMVEKGRTPLLGAKRLQELGFSIAIFPATGFLAAGAALEQAYQALQDTGSSEPVLGELYDFDRFSRLMGFEQVWEFERAHAD
ncbi:isocitrate lyase/PEP mutase family protein [Pelomicrobium methylotrophicum]|uniref:Isocitrate lyase/PEP mutase family protein n=1 Tax=Pelomicrobium methylotrophicum TaxID=2602750 RepID=A0A5C7EEB6_9PROT|nr:isocitrate lyase/PEP mutase family protein [Pelomicrobium methylotrophicum]TXF09877.1 isocitrate lyase/PEP mutase family protein [Pelomicrobium methylotrophicum]